MMNILFLYWGKKGGGAKYSLEIAKELSLRDDTNLHLSISRQCEIIDQFESISAPTFYVDTYESIAGFLNTYFIRKYKLKNNLESYLKEHKIDVIIIGMDFFWGSVINDAAHRSGAKTILVVHEPVPHPKESVPMKFFKNRNLKKSIPGADHVVALTEHVRRYIEENYGVKHEKTSVIPHGIFSYYKTEEPRKIKKNKNLFKILYFGRIDYYKGLDILLDAFLELEKTRDDIQLEIWGSGDLKPYDDQIHKIKNIRIENRWVDEEEITEAFKDCDLCVLPYREASQSGIVGIASHAAMPIIACPSEGLKEQLSDYGAIITDDFTPNSLRKSIQKLLEDPHLYEQLSKQAIEYGKQLSWESIADDFFEISSKIISE
ncbi:MAG: glycosyltransferase family 4 protein [Balneolaceae bacterium]|nr:glycosyltransferase family 4 protein [Balneolaceae bacterium]